MVTRSRVASSVLLGLLLVQLGGGLAAAPTVERAAAPARVAAVAGGAADWRWPLGPPVRVARRFDPPATPYGPGHRGVDLAGPAGALVRAAGPGVVGYAGQLAGRGVVTVLHSDGLRTTYEPVAVAVRVGARVAGGTVLGTLLAGHAGCGRFPACLHWGLLRATHYLDPLALLGWGRVRLLPLRPADLTVARPGRGA